MVSKSNEFDARTMSLHKVLGGPGSDLFENPRHPRFTLGEALMPGIIETSMDMHKEESTSNKRIIRPLSTLKSLRCSLQMVPLQIEVIDEASKASLDHVWEEGRMSAKNQLIPRKNLSINSICTDIVT
jgi:hypothetical protein